MYVLFSYAHITPSHAVGAFTNLKWSIYTICKKLWLQWDQSVTSLTIFMENKEEENEGRTGIQDRTKYEEMMIQK
jgi:hypothetical protein